jgi:hypothetical protein
VVVVVVVETVLLVLVFVVTKMIIPLYGVPSVFAVTIDGTPVRASSYNNIPTTSPDGSTGMAGSMGMTGSDMASSKAGKSMNPALASVGMGGKVNDKKGGKSTMNSITSSPTTLLTVAVATSVVLVAVGVVLSRKKLAMRARARVHPFTDAPASDTDAATNDTALPTTYDSSQISSHWAVSSGPRSRPFKA